MLRLSSAFKALVVGSSLASFTNPVVANEPSRQEQLVLISFDGARDIAQWKRSRALAERSGARFTYFVSCTFLIPNSEKAGYRAPGQAAGKSNIGFASERSEIHKRLVQITLAQNERHEIASHACGHFDGGKWSSSDWATELRSFRQVFKTAWQRIGRKEPRNWQAFVDREIVGFRAPYLAVSSGLNRALRDNGFAYDASTVSGAPGEIVEKNGLASIPLPMVPEGPSGRKLIAMDYNLFVRHSAALESPRRSKEFEDRAYRAFLEAFETQYQGKRAPLSIGFHFTLMNAGAYWRALERFVDEVCTRSDVACVSHREAVRRSRTGLADLRTTF